MSQYQGKKLHLNEIRQTILNMGGTHYSKQRKAEEILLKTEDPRFLEMILEMLEADDAKTVASAIHALNKLKHFNPAQYLPKISLFLDSPFYCEAVLVFMRQHAEKSLYLKRLFALLSHIDDDIRHIALRKISEFSYPYVDNLLDISLMMCNDSSAGVRALACRILGSFYQSEKAADGLMEMLHDNETHGYYGLTVASTAVESLGRIGDKRAIEPLKARLPDADGELADSIVSVLFELGDASLLPFFHQQAHEHYSHTARFCIVRELRYSGDASSVEPMIALLRHESNEEMQKAIAETLDMLGDARGTAIAKAWFKENNKNQLRKRYGLKPKTNQ